MNEPILPQESIFAAALDVPAAERPAFLDRACSGNNALRAEVEELLRAHEQSGDLLDLPEETATFHQTTLHRPGMMVGPYKLLQQIGEGGMGTVFMAEQTRPVQRKVALKIIKPGMDSRQIIARFEAERQALALMDHPNIAKVFDGGVCSAGRPYFAMELVKGVPITEYCDEHHLTPRERLGLFVHVCRAVQHAHQKGIIHRDLKPSNVMVARYDGEPVPKIIDFGVAKATGPKLTDATFFTEFGKVLGTLEYMSPEQADLNQLDIDTRSDIYSLGVLLFELLTGTTPLERKRLKQAGMLEVLRLIREEDPPRPSARLSTTAELPSIAANRGLEPKKLNGLVRGELDWIVMKCLEKDRNRRYETANGLAHDIERYLNDEPVQACAPSTGYRLRKFVRRNKRAVLATSLVLSVVVIGMIGITWSMIQATRAKADLVGEAKLKDEALAAAQQSERNANDQLFLSLVNQARALRFSGQVGQRFEGLKALAEATRIARTRGITDDEMVKLRNEAIACLAAPDLRFERVLMPRFTDTVPESYWLAFDPSFRHFAFGDKDGNIGIRRVADGEETAQLAGSGRRPEWVSLKFSPDGGWLLVHRRFPGRPAQNELWELQSGKPGRKFDLEHTCDFSPDGKFIAGARPDGSVGVYETATGQQVKRLADGMGLAGGVFSPNGRQLAVWLKSARPSILVVLDLETGKEVARYPLPADAGDEPSWRGDGGLLAIPCNDQRIYTWNCETRQLQSVLEGHTALGIGVNFSHAGDFLISRSWDGSIRFWDPISGRQLLHLPDAFFVAIRNDDRQAAVLKDGHLTLWEVAGGWECRTLHHGQIGNRTERPRHWGPTAMDFSPDGRLLVSSSLDGVRLWDMDAFAEVGFLPSKPTVSAVFHPVDSGLFTYGTGGLQRWPIRREIERAAARPVETEVLHIGPPQALDVPGNWTYAGISLDRQGHRLAAIDFSHGRALVLDLGSPVRKIVLENRAIAGCFLSPDGEWAVTTFVGPGLKVWNTSDGKPVPWSPPAGERFLCFTADSRWLVTAPPGQLHFHFWQIGTGQLESTSANNKRLTSPSTSPDGSVFLWTDSGALPPKLFNTHTERLLAVLEPPRDIGSVGLRFSPDGEKLVVGSGNHTMHVWDLREIRRELADLGLDWDLPPYPPKTPRDPRPIRVEVTATKPAP